MSRSRSSSNRRRRSLKYSRHRDAPQSPPRPRDEPGALDWADRDGFRESENADDAWWFDTGEDYPRR
jgi:hypothetical protein